MLSVWVADNSRTKTSVFSRSRFYLISFPCRRTVSGAVLLSLPRQMSALLLLGASPSRIIWDKAVVVTMLFSCPAPSPCTCCHCASPRCCHPRCSSPGPLGRAVLVGTGQGRSPRELGTSCGPKKWAFSCPSPASDYVFRFRASK